MGDLRTAAPRTLEPRLRHDFFANICCHGEASVAPRREMSVARNSQSSTVNVPKQKRAGWLAESRAKDFRGFFYCVVRQVSHPVVKWAVLELHHWMCHRCPCAPPSWGKQCLKQPKFSNARAIIVLNIVLAEQNSWATCGSLRQRLSSFTTTWICFGKFCCRGEVSGTWKRQSSTIHVPLS